MERAQRYFRRLTPLQDVHAILRERFGVVRTQTETVPTRAARDRVLVHEVRSARSVPAHHVSAVDGIAVRASSTFGARPESPVLLTPGPDAKPVNTGEALPPATDAVVMIEHVEETDGAFEVREPVHPWQHVRKAGEDVVRGELVLPALHRVRPIDQGILLAAGVLVVDVFRRPRVLVLPTGNELILPEDAPDPVPPGGVLEFNGQVLASLAIECGAEADIGRPVPDVAGRLKDAVSQGLDAGYDLVLVVAGSSAGSEDHTPEVLDALGELLVHGVTLMPGKPTLIAAVRGRPVIGIPGYPVSAVIAFREFVRPLIYLAQGLEPPSLVDESVTAGRKLPSKLGLEEHVRVILGRVGERTVATPLPGGAASLSSLVRADAIVRIPQDVSGVAEGEPARAELLTPADRIRERLLVIGSHDLTIDLLASLVHERSAGRASISSTNAGSMGGLLALKRGTAHLAGSHLLDIATGGYNESYVRRILPGVRMTLVTLAHRWQGFIVPRGNPQGIAGIGDLVRADVSFVNRQGGSGTRVLLDYELSQAGVDAAAIAGYRSEEYTHMAVAMAVASGRASTGLGIAAAAQALDLDFVPLARERYDLVLHSSLMDDARFRLLLDIIRSSTFRERLVAMGGYEAGETGTVVEIES